MAEYFKAVEIDLNDTIERDSELYGKYLLTKVAEFNLYDALIKDRVEPWSLRSDSDRRDKLLDNIGAVETVTRYSEEIMGQEVGNWDIYTALCENNRKNLPIGLKIKTIKKLLK